MDALIKIREIYKSFGKDEVLKGITTDLHKGEIVAIIGPSGSGKSTLIRCMNGLEKLDRGEIIVDGLRVDNTKTVAGKVGMVFQSFNLFPHYTVIDNIIKPCRVVRKMKEKDAKELALSLLEKIRLVDKANEYPGNLSGGQKQRVAIARSLSMNPEIILFDEPTSSLDPELAYEVFDTIKSIVKDDLTILLVTHQMNMVTNFASRVLFLENGMITLDGTPDLLMNTSNERIQQFLERIFF